jgi:hypothetical protein
MDEHMKACMLEVYMAMTGNNFFPKNQVPLIVAQMVYAKVVLRVPSNEASNVPLYQLNRFVLANPVALPKTHSPPTTIHLILTRRPRVLP